MFVDIEGSLYAWVPLGLSESSNDHRLDEEFKADTLFLFPQRPPAVVLTIAI